jgi:hypothetical protein
MTLRKPRLDWIKEVLADLEDSAVPVPSSAGTVWSPPTASDDRPPVNDRPGGPEDDDQLLCPSRQLMRLAAIRKSRL